MKWALFFAGLCGVTALLSVIPIMMFLTTDDFGALAAAFGAGIGSAVTSTALYLLAAVVDNLIALRKQLCSRPSEEDLHRYFSDPSARQ